MEKAEAFVCNIAAVTVESAMERKSPTYKSCLASFVSGKSYFSCDAPGKRATSIPAVVSGKAKCVDGENQLVESHAFLPKVWLKTYGKKANETA